MPQSSTPTGQAMRRRYIIAIRGKESGRVVRLEKVFAFWTKREAQRWCERLSASMPAFTHGDPLTEYVVLDRVTGWVVEK